MKLKQKQTTFYCFSPPVMIATCIIEVALLVYTLYRYKLTPLTRVSLATLGFLALFQASEFAVCGASASTVDLWSRIGYISITLLPPLGIHLISSSDSVKAHFKAISALAIMLSSSYSQA